MKTIELNEKDRKISEQIKEFNREIEKSNKEIKKINIKMTLILLSYFTIFWLIELFYCQTIEEKFTFFLACLSGGFVGKMLVEIWKK